MESKDNFKLITKGIQPAVLLSEEDIQEFKQLAKEEWNIELTDRQAKDQAEKMVKFGMILNQFDINDPIVIQKKKEENLNQ